MGQDNKGPDEKTLKFLEDMANKLRIHSIESTNAAGSGLVAKEFSPFCSIAGWIVVLTVRFLFCSHPTSCCSMAEIMSVLFFHTMRYKGEFECSLA